MMMVWAAWRVMIDFMEEIQQIFSGHLKQLCTRAQALTKLNNYVQNLLPAPLKPHCQVANLHEGTLVMLVDSAVWANQLRFYQTTLLRAWQPDQAGSQAPRQLAIRIASKHVAEKAPSAKPELSEESAALLESTADSLSDQGLREALRRLAKNHR